MPIVIAALSIGAFAAASRRAWARERNDVVTGGSPRRNPDLLGEVRRDAA